MLSFMNYNFCSDYNVLDAMPTDVNPLNTLTLNNGIFDRIRITKDLSQLDNLTIPEIWDKSTIMDADFKNNLAGGNIDFTLDQIKAVALKRRRKNELQWITLETHKVNTAKDLNILFKDTLTKNDTYYEYALVPILNIENNIEGNYYTAEIFSQYDGIFICDFDTIYKLYAGVNYNSFARVQRVATLEPMGRKFPIVINNSSINYTIGSVTGTILPKSFEETGEFNRRDMAIEREELLDFLTNKKAKVIKDWNGNLWLVMITGTPAISFKNGYGMGIADVTFDAVEIGDAENQNDLVETGIVKSTDYLGGDEVNERNLSRFNLYNLS